MIIHVSPHFTIDEVTHSQMAERLGLDNSIQSGQILEVVKKTAAWMEVVREVLGVPININSWARSLLLNRALHSKDNSQHLKGEAVDFIAPAFGTPYEICQHLEKHRAEVNYDQLIMEFSWVHISWNSMPNVPQRGLLLSLLPSGGYANGLQLNT